MDLSNSSGLIVNTSDIGVAQYLSTNKSFHFLGSSSISFRIIFSSSLVLAHLIAPTRQDFIHIPQFVHNFSSTVIVSLASSK